MLVKSTTTFVSASYTKKDYIKPKFHYGNFATKFAIKFVDFHGPHP